MAYLWKHTPLQTTFPVNMTCLVPTENAEVGRPERLDLHQMLWYFLKFRLDVVTARLEHELGALKKRIHILEGFEKVFDALDEILRIIRKSDGKADAAEKIIARFGLDAEQTDAILELKIYRLARLEILVITNELAEKRRRAKQIGGLLKSEQDRWDLVRDEIAAVQKKYADPKKDPRRTELSSDAGEVEYTADDFIVEEDNVVIVSRDGWVKRQKEVKDLASTRLREGDAVLAVLPGQHARDGRVLLELRHGLHVPHRRRAGVDRLRRADPEAVQVQGRRTDRGRAEPRPPHREAHHAGEGRRGAAGARAGGDDATATACGSVSTGSSSRARAPAAATRGAADGAEVVGVAKIDGSEIVIAATQSARAMLCKVDGDQLPVGTGPRRHPDQADGGGRQGAGLHRVDRRPGPADRRDQPRRRADDQHDEIRGDRPRRQGARAAAARASSRDRPAAAGRSDAVELAAGCSSAGMIDAGRACCQPPATRIPLDHG